MMLLRTVGEYKTNISTSARVHSPRGADDPSNGTARWIVGAFLLMVVTVSGAWGNSHDTDSACRTTSKGGGLACLSQQGLEEAVHAGIDCRENDNCGWLQSILDGGSCVFMKKGLRVRIKDGGFFLSEIYLFPPGEDRPVPVFTYNDNFEC